LAKKYHPDTNKDPASTNKFKEISAAYKILSDPQEKQRYNQFGGSNSQGGFNTSNYGNSHTYTYSGDINPEEIFKEFFKDTSWSNFEGNFFQSRARSNQSFKRTTEPLLYQTNVQISFEDSIRGITVEKHLNLDTFCKRCQGEGSEPGSGLTKCVNCSGSGYVAQNLGNMMFVRTLCQKCEGTGSVIRFKCTECKGSGRVEKTCRVKADIRSGIVSGESVRVVESGCEILFNVDVRKSHKFWREGLNIHSNVDISFCQGCLGGTVLVDCIHEIVNIKVFFFLLFL
ncbi:MAG: DnaJ subfamily A member 3, mitochondrial, partial [Paramarteilia canceri]